jgi:ATP-binding cassette subfamily B protein
LISHWEKAYETVLGPVFQGGTEPSLGQWQRLALARAFFRDAALIVLDEPAASLDPRSEYRLYQAMQAFLPNRGILLISHRLSSVRMADRIYVLEAGRIIEEGSHIELLRNNGLYAELHRLQTHDPAVGSVTKDCGSRLGSRGTPAPIH